MPHECSDCSSAQLSLLRLHPRRVRLRAPLLEPASGPAKVATVNLPLDRRLHFRRRRAVLSDLVRVRRHPDRSVRLRARAPRDLVGPHGAGVRLDHGHAWSSSCRPRPAGPARPHTESIFGQTPRIVLRVDHGVLLRRIRQLVHTLAKNEDLDRTAMRCGRACVGSTIAGESVDSLVFYPCAFLGVWETQARR